MADPVTMGVIGIGSSVAKGFLGAGQASNQAAAQRLSIQGQMMKTMADAFGLEVQAQQYTYEANKNKYQAAVADMNKEISEANARYSLEVGEVEAQESGMKSAAEMGEMIASQGASGIDVSSGSSAKVRDSMVEISNYQQEIIRSSAAKKAYGYTVEATQYKAQGDVYRYTAQQNEDQADASLKGAAFTRSGMGLQQQAMGLVGKSESMNIMGSLIGAAGSVADKWSSGGMTGLTSGIKSLFSG